MVQVLKSARSARLAIFFQTLAAACLVLQARSSRFQGKAIVLTVLLALLLEALSKRNAEAVSRGNTATLLLLLPASLAILGMLLLALETKLVAHVNQGLTQIALRPPTAPIASQEGIRTAQAAHLALLAHLDAMHRAPPGLFVMNAMRGILVGQKLGSVKPVQKALIQQRLPQSVNLANLDTT